MDLQQHTDSKAQPIIWRSELKGFLLILGFGHSSTLAVLLGY